MELPLVSVLMTAYNRQDYIAQAIESVLASTLQNFELIIVDDKSTDNTVKVARIYELQDNRVRVYINETNLGDYPNRNKAATYARGKYIKYLDSDDVIYPHCLEVMVKSMEAFPDAGYGLSSLPDSKGIFPSCISPETAYLEHFFTASSHYNRSPGSAIILTEAFHKVGGFTHKRHIGDTELWFTLSRDYQLVKFPRDLVWHRSHENTESKIESNSKHMRKIREQLVATMLNSENCPLSVSQKEKVYRRLKQQKFKSKALRLSVSLGKLIYR